ncbi:MAG: 6-carboxytetrahydropterin synthase QueD [Planctomycetota bacterium]|nr:6-carboxytetrahydropterin synthase QueD [Planctomycetota bacterium]MDI6787379.1 6-carboxytetrahydropterin synthase QueD [Planctomycetota bacterium]
MYELVIKSSFSAAHHLRNYHGKCEKLHGHNYDVEVYVQGNKLDKTGMLIDFTILKSILEKTLSGYDHKYLNELKDFRGKNPTAENIAYLISQKVRKKLPEQIPMDIGIKVCIWESSRTGACYYAV